jgi:hypothetical protein
VSTRYGECEDVKVDGVVGQSAPYEKTSSPSTVRGLTLHLRLGDWARHRHAARQCAAAESQEGLAPHRYFIFANVILQSLGVCRMIMNNML